MRQARAHVELLSLGKAVRKNKLNERSGLWTFLWVFFIAMLGPLGAGPHAKAQVQWGDASLHLDGTLSGGYNGEFSNVNNSNHNSYGAGIADLFGSYHDPNFLGFSVSPFYNQSNLNSNYQSITAASGVDASASLFGGSMFPGSISYSKVFNSTGNYGIPLYTAGNPEGVVLPQTYTTNSDNDTLAVNWALLWKNWPRLNFNYAQGGTDYSLYGSNASGHAHFDTTSLMTSYNWDGFYMGGGFQHSGSHSLLPGVLLDEPSNLSNSTTNTLSFNVTHALPWHGSGSVGFTRSTIDSMDTESGQSVTNYNATINTVNGNVNATPIKYLNVGANVYYTDNLEGTLYQSLLTAGAILPGQGQSTSSALNVTAFGNYDVGTHLHFMGTFMRQDQFYAGASFGSNSVNGTVSYNNWFKGGSLSVVGGVSETWLTTTQHSNTGTNDSIMYSRRTLGWNLTGSCSYSQNVQTVLIAYTTSGFNCSGGMGRRFGAHTYWGAYAGIQRSLITDQPNTANSGQFYSTTLSMRLFSVSGSYSKSSGNSLITPTGLVPSPIPPPVLNPESLVFFASDAYSAGVGASPIPGMTITASYSRAVSNTQTTNSTTTTSNNFNQYITVLLYHNFRQLHFTAGYNRLVQGFSIAGVPPANVTAFYAGVTRNFNFF